MCLICRGRHRRQHRTRHQSTPRKTAFQSSRFIRRYQNRGVFSLPLPLDPLKGRRTWFSLPSPERAGGKCVLLALNLHTEQSENVASFVAVDRVGSASPHSQRTASGTHAQATPQTRHPSCFLPMMMWEIHPSLETGHRARARLLQTYRPLTSAIACGLLPLSAWQHS